MLLHNQCPTAATKKRRVISSLINDDGDDGDDRVRMAMIGATERLWTPGGGATTRATATMGGRQNGSELPEEERRWGGDGSDARRATNDARRVTGLAPEGRRRSERKGRRERTKTRTRGEVKRGREARGDWEGGMGGKTVGEAQWELVCGNHPRQVGFGDAIWGGNVQRRVGERSEFLTSTGRINTSIHFTNGKLLPNVEERYVCIDDELR